MDLGRFRQRLQFQGGFLCVLRLLPNNKLSQQTLRGPVSASMSSHLPPCKQSLEEVYKYSTPESVVEFEKELISEETFRDRARVKKQRDLMPPSKKKQKDKERHANLTDKQWEAKRRRTKEYRERIKT